MRPLPKNRILIIVSALLLQLLLSCAMMKEDRTDCPDCRNPLHVTLRYDYNTARANMFSDHVEEATCFVVDAVSGKVVDVQTARNTSTAAPLRDASFGFNFEGLTAGDYRLYALGRSQGDAHHEIQLPDVAEDISRLQFALPTDADGNPMAQRLDTLWNALQPVDVTMQNDAPAQATVSLMRLTNDLNVLLFRTDTPTANSHQRYQVTVTDSHAVLGADNQPRQEQPVVYRPFASWTTETYTRADGDGVLAERNAHYDLSLSRLIQHEQASKNAHLHIVDTDSGTEVVNIDLCYYLALARNAYETRNYDVQEYLDREYDYRMAFWLDGNNWRYMTISISVLSWTLRIQNEML